jgi:hypothetical protein
MGSDITRPRRPIGQPRYPRRTVAGIAALLAPWAVVAGALAGPAQPGKRYSGFTSERPVNGFHAPVTFRVSAGGARLMGFQFASQGCFGSGSPLRDVFKDRSKIERLATIKLSPSGRFSITAAKSTFTVKGQTTVTRTNVSGHFRTAGLVTGRITYRQTFTDTQTAGSTCGPLSFTFSAKLG